MGLTMDKLQLTGTWAKFCMLCNFFMLSVNLPYLKLKTQPKQLLGSLPLVIKLLGLTNSKFNQLGLYLLFYLACLLK